MSEPLLDVKNLSVSFHTYAGEVQAVRDISFQVRPGECMAIVGESGSGKTVTSKAVLGLLASPPGEVKKESRIFFEGENILAFNEKQWRKFRGKEAAMIFQDPMTSLNPTMKTGRQIAESILLHNKISRSEARAQAKELLKRVNIPNPAERLNQYPYEFSGGMRQRVVIAIALACNPKLMIADEPTTALDVTIQAQIMKLLKEIQKKNNTAVIMITHDLGVVAGMAEYITVMYAGCIAEHGRAEEIFENPGHPYTHALLNAVPNMEKTDKSRLLTIPGTPPDLIMPPKGCGFAGRCQYCMGVCKEYAPEFTSCSDTHKAACWLHHPLAKQVLGQERIRGAFKDE